MPQLPWTFFVRFTYSDSAAVPIGVPVRVSVGVNVLVPVGVLVGVMFFIPVEIYFYRYLYVSSPSEVPVFVSVGLPVRWFLFYCV